MKNSLNHINNSKYLYILENLSTDNNEFVSQVLCIKFMNLLNSYINIGGNLYE